MKITDKMRLNWLSQRGWGQYGYIHAGYQVYFESADTGKILAESLRKVIDKSIRAQTEKK